MQRVGLMAMAVALVAAGCARPTPRPLLLALMVRSGGFAAGGRMPARFTADGADQSPPLEWTGAPRGTAGFAVTCDDPDAPGGPWLHWTAYGIPAFTTRLGEGVPPVEQLPDGWRQGRNDFGRVGYGGPAPPAGPVHRYRFRVYAVDAACPLPGGAGRREVEGWLAGHTLAKGEVTGLYSR